MSSVDPAQAALLSVCAAGRPTLSACVTNQLGPRVPVLESPFKCAERVRVSSLPAPSFIPSGGTLGTSPISWSQPASYAQITLRRVGALVDVNGDLLRNVSQVEPVLEWQVALMERAIDEAVWREWCAASPAADAGPGLFQFGTVNPTGSIDAAGAALSLDLLAQMRRHISWRATSSPPVYVMHSRLFEGLEAAARAAFAPIPYLAREPGGELLPYVGASPVLLCDHISLAETTGPATSSVYLLRLGRGPQDPVGVEGLSVLAPSGAAGLQRSAPEPIDSTHDVWRTAVWRDCALTAGSEDCAVLLRRVLTPS